MAIQSDDKGFLTGEPVDTDETNKLLVEIRDEFRSFRTDLTNIGVKLKPIRSQPTETVSTASRDSRGRFTSATTVKQPLNDSSSHPKRTVSASTDAVNTVPKPVSQIPGRTVIEPKQPQSAFRTLFSSRYKPKDEGLPWYKRIFRELRLSRKESGQYSKAEVVAIKKLDKPVTSGSKNGSGFLDALIGALLPVLLTVLKPILAIVDKVGKFKKSVATVGLGAALGLDSGSVSTFFSDLKTRILEDWAIATKDFVALFKPMADWLKDKLGIVTKPLKALPEKANKAVKDSTGIDVKSGYDKAVDFTSRKVIEPIAKAGKWLGDKINLFKNADMSPKGLNIKSQEALAGGHTQRGTLALAHTLQDKIPGLKRFTAFDDAYHHSDAYKAKKRRAGKSEHSVHQTGRALDFTISDPSKSGETAVQVRALLKEMGVQGRVINEYASKSSAATGGHIHVELASDAESNRVATLAMPSKPALVSVSSPVTVMARPQSVKPIAIAEAPSVVTPLLSPKGLEQDKSQFGNYCGQDVSSKEIAWIISGGYSARH